MVYEPGHALSRVTPRPDGPSSSPTLRERIRPGRGTRRFGRAGCVRRFAALYVDPRVHFGRVGHERERNPCRCAAVSEGNRKLVALARPEILHGLNEDRALAYVENPNPRPVTRKCRRVDRARQSVDRQRAFRDRRREEEQRRRCLLDANLGQWRGWAPDDGNGPLPLHARRGGFGSRHSSPNEHERKGQSCRLQQWCMTSRMGTLPSPICAQGCPEQRVKAPSARRSPGSAHRPASARPGGRGCPGRAARP